MAWKTQLQEPAVGLYPFCVHPEHGLHRPPTLWHTCCFMKSTYLIYPKLWFPPGGWRLSCCLSLTYCLIHTKRLNISFKNKWLAYQCEDIFWGPQIRHYYKKNNLFRVSRFGIMSLATGHLDSSTKSFLSFFCYCHWTWVYHITVDSESELIRIEWERN